MKTGVETIGMRGILRKLKQITEAGRCGGMACMAGQMTLADNLDAWMYRPCSVKFIADFDMYSPLAPASR